MSKFNEYDLKHSATLLHKLNNLKVDQKAISEIQIDALFVEPNEIIIYYEGEEPPIINTHLSEELYVEEEVQI